MVKNGNSQADFLKKYLKITLKTTYFDNRKNTTINAAVDLRTTEIRK